jgi:hypothetical protein
MKKEVGLWIDHHRTVMVTLANEKEMTWEIRSNIEKHLRLSGGLRAKKPNGSTMSKAEDVGDRRYGNHLNGYYDGVVSFLRNADSIWIFGPGEAKGELKKRLERENLDGRIYRVETAGKMTDRQITAKVRQHFET